ncbi:MAG: hypothetical protein M1835_000649 [Candelina submexicana]|nr:MAG: hypothetical protein M1835_000649 [Candelina submexicana]
MADLTSDPPTSIDPYETLGLERTATSDQIKTAYRKAALKHHPDKAPTADQSAAHEKFLSITFAYAILSSPSRRKHYDTTGSTSETLSHSEDFNWADFYHEQYGNAITSETLEKFKEEYKCSEEEKEDVLAAYRKFEGDMDGVFEDVMLSDVLVDEERFRGIIDEAISNGVVEAYKKYTKESKAKRQKRIKKAKGEEAEARELAEELGIADKLFGNAKSKDGKTKGGGKASKKANSEDALAALIQQRQKGRSETFLDNLEAKYAGGATKKRKSKAANNVDDDDDEPSEEAFQKAASRLKGPKKGVKPEATEEVNGEGIAKRRAAKRAKK